MLLIATSLAYAQTDSVIDTTAVPLVTGDDADAEASQVQAAASVLGAARDVFYAPAFTRFQNSGYRYRGGSNSTAQTLLINGIVLNDVENGFASYQAFSGLGEVTRNRQSNIGLDASDFALGSMGGVFNVDTRAGGQRKGFNLNYAATNRNFRNRISATYNTGYLKGDWAFSVSLGRRWASQGYEKGTNFDGWSYFFSVEKRFKNKHFVSLTAIGAQQSRAVAGPVVGELQRITGDPYYNPYWGYENGQVRSANTRKQFTPNFILNYEAKINNKTNVLVAAGYDMGYTNRGGLDFTSATNPAPDYYRNLPSYLEDGVERALDSTRFASSDSARGIQWDNITQQNQIHNDTVTNAYNNGTKGNTVTGHRSAYVMSDQVAYHKRFNFNTTLHHTFSDHTALNGGVSYQYKSTENYRELTDLLGGDFYVDVNRFAVLDFPADQVALQNDTARPNRILRVGDKYDYDYNITYHKGGLWLEPKFKFERIEFYIGAGADYNYYWRTGLVTSGIFSTNSYGDSRKLSMFTYNLKGGLTYKINGRNNIFVRGSYQTLAPTILNSFISVRTRNDIATNLAPYTSAGAELGYEFKSQTVRAKATLYYNQTSGETRTNTFFHDDFRTNVNYNLTGISTRSMGYEIGLDFKIYKGFSINGISALNRYQYSDDAVASITKDNSAGLLLAGQKTFLKGLNIGRIPQSASSIGLNYQGKQRWYISMNANYFDLMWVQPNPIRRTQEAIDLVAYDSPKYHEIFDQERLAGQFTMDIRGGYTLDINRAFKVKSKAKYLIAMSASITNLTNNTSFVNSGTEQLRYDFTENNINKFATKYQYYRGIGYYLTIALQIR
jgi:hypothetical protein